MKKEQQIQKNNPNIQGFHNNNRTVTKIFVDENNPTGYTVESRKPIDLETTEKYQIKSTQVTAILVNSITP